MISEGKVFATIAVKDLTAGQQYYGGILGLTKADENIGGVTYESGSGRLFIYQSPTAGTNQATCAAWQVADVESAVQDLKSKGVSFETYDIPGATWNDEVAVMGDIKAAWFKDPDGNILSVVN